MNMKMDAQAGQVRILHILPWVMGGGVERRRMQLAQQLPKDRFEQRVVCLYAKGAFLRGIEDAGVPVISLDKGSGSVFDIPTITRVVREARRFRPHIIHGAVFEGNTLAALAGTIAKVPKIVVEETSDPRPTRSWRGDLLMGGLTRLANRSVGVSPIATAYLRDRLRLGPEQVRLIMNGVAQPRTPSAGELSKARRGLGLSDSDFVVGTAGRIYNDTKRFSDLLVAVSLVAERLPKLKVLVVGEGPDLPMLQTMVHDLKIDDRVAFTGRQGDMGKMYHLMDVFALASGHEAFGLVLAEAMFCSKPVIATRVGGIPYVVDEGHTGFLVEPFQPGALAALIRVLHDDPSLCARLGANGRARAEEHFSEERYVREVEALYLELMDEL